MSIAAAVGRAAVRDELGKDVVGSSADAIEPIVKHDNPFRVIATWLGRVVEDERRVEPAVELQAHMRVEEERPRVGGGELVDIASARPDRVLRHSRDAVSRIAQSYAVPVHRGVRRQLVVDRHSQEVARRGPNRLSRNAIAVCPGVDGDPAEVEGGALGGEGRRDQLLSRARTSRRHRPDRLAVTHVHADVRRIAGVCGVAGMPGAARGAGGKRTDADHAEAPEQEGSTRQLWGGHRLSVHW
jgi:hypothetical protein